MPLSPERQRLNKEKGRRMDSAVENGDVTPEDAQAIRKLCNAYDEMEFDVQPPVGDDGQSKRHRAPSTIALWCQRLRLTATEGINLTEASSADVNKVCKKILQEKGLSKNTVRGYQDSLRVFYRYHDDLGVSPEEIATIQRQSSKIDPTDMLTGEEIRELRNAATHTRDQCIVDLFMYTGQRNKAIRSLRIRDIDLDNGRYRLNPEADGLKRADENGEWRPLLLAESSVRRWIQQHPCKDNPNAYLICPKPEYNPVDPGKMLARNAISRVTQQLKKKTDITKPLHPHALRHNFVTICKRDYEMDDGTIKYLIGHGQGSNIMQTTYAHLSDEDHNMAAEQAWGLREEEDKSTLSPDVCPQCQEPLPAESKACPNCGLVFTPDAQAVKDQIEEDIMKDMVEAESKKDREFIKRFKEIIEENPEALAKLLEED